MRLAEEAGSVVLIGLGVGVAGESVVVADLSPVLSVELASDPVSAAVVGDWPLGSGKVPVCRSACGWRCGAVLVAPVDVVDGVEDGSLPIDVVVSADGAASPPVDGSAPPG